jgi:hypothetical protein
VRARYNNGFEQTWLRHAAQAGRYSATSDLYCSCQVDKNMLDNYHYNYEDYAGR